MKGPSVYAPLETPMLYLNLHLKMGMIKHKTAVGVTLVGRGRTTVCLFSFFMASVKAHLSSAMDQTHSKESK